MTDISDLDLDFDDTVPICDGVPYMAEGLRVLKIESDRWDDEMVVAGDRCACQSHHDWAKVPEGADPAYVCWNCDAVKFPVEVLLDD